jgi:hypothetical protein
MWMEKRGRQHRVYYRNPLPEKPNNRDNVAFTAVVSRRLEGGGVGRDVLRLLSGRAASAVAAVRTPVAALRAQLLIAGAAET